MASPATPYPRPAQWRWLFLPQVWRGAARHPAGAALSAYADGELAASAAAVEEHVRACGRCRVTIAEYRSAGELVRQLPPRLAPAGLRRSVAQRLAAR
jgi:anti-sigma factor RsiW